MKHNVALTVASFALIIGLSLTARAAPAQCSEGGYPLAVASADPAVDEIYLNAFARAAAYRWQVPSGERSQYTNWQRVRDRTLPPEPRWADDWRPSARHRAQLSLTVQRNGRASAGELVVASGDRDFDRSLRTIAGDPMPGTPPLPPFPAGAAGDSIAVRLYFGYDTVPAPHAVIHFAATQTPVRMGRPGVPFSVPRSPYATTPARRYAIIKYDVTENGHVRPGSVELLDSSDRDFEIAVRDNVQQQRFEPATQNCRPITMTVVQRVGT